MIEVGRLNNFVGARLNRVVLYAASLSLKFEKEGYEYLSLSINCDFLIEGDKPTGEYPLSPQAFTQLTSTIDGRVEGFVRKTDGNYELRIEGRAFILRDEGASGGIFGLSGRPEGQTRWDEFF